MTYGASAQVAQKIKNALDAKGETLLWLADESGVARETTRRKIGTGAGELTMGEVTAYCRALGLDAGRVISPIINEALS